MSSRVLQKCSGCLCWVLPVGLSCSPAPFWGRVPSWSLQLCSVTPPPVIPGDEGCSWGAALCPPGLLGSLGSSAGADRALLCADRQTDRHECAVRTWSTARGTWKADVGSGPAGGAPLPLPPVPLRPGLESGARQGSGELSAALAERNVCSCGLCRAQNQPQGTLHGSWGTLRKGRCSHCCSPFPGSPRGEPCWVWVLLRVCPAHPSPAPSSAPSPALLIPQEQHWGPGPFSSHLFNLPKKDPDG